MLLNGCFFLDWIYYVFDVNIWSYFVGCKIYMFFVYLFIDFSNWILVVVIVDCCIVVCCLLKVRIYDYFWICKVIVVFIFIVMIVLNFYLFWNMEFINEEEFCNEVNYFILYVWLWIDFFVFCVLLFLIMFVCNVLFLKVIVKFRRKVILFGDLRIFFVVSLREVNMFERRFLYLMRMFFIVSFVFFGLIFLIIIVELFWFIFVNDIFEVKVFVKYKLVWIVGNMF